jgi:hypothetical protein
MLSFYNQCLLKYSLATNCTTALFVYSIGDIAAQYIERQNKHVENLSADAEVEGKMTALLPDPVSVSVSSPLAFVDWSRTQEMLVWSAGIYTPLFVVLYKQMDARWPTNSPRHICLKVAASSLANIPTLCLFFAFGVAFPPLKSTLLATDRGAASPSLDVAAIAHDSCTRIRKDLLSTLTMGFAYWWPVNAVIFRCVPSLLRPAGMSVCSVAWGCYLSMVQFKHAGEEEGFN